MDKTLYVSGFLYNLKTNQILLIKPTGENEENILWSLIGGDSLEGESVQDSFSQIVNKLLTVTLKPKDIHPVYDYFDETLKKTNHVFYAKVGRNFKFDPPKKSTLVWVTFDETAKLPFSPSVKQDVIVGKRVIDAQLRDSETAIEARKQAQIQNRLN